MENVLSFQNHCFAFLGFVLKMRGACKLIVEDSNGSFTETMLRTKSLLPFQFREIRLLVHPNRKSNHRRVCRDLRQ